MSNLGSTEKIAIKINNDKFFPYITVTGVVGSKISSTELTNGVKKQGQNARGVSSFNSDAFKRSLQLKAGGKQSLSETAYAAKQSDLQRDVAGDAAAFLKIKQKQGSLLPSDEALFTNVLAKGDSALSRKDMFAVTNRISELTETGDVATTLLEDAREVVALLRAGKEDAVRERGFDPLTTETLAAHIDAPNLSNFAHELPIETEMRHVAEKPFGMPET